MNKYLNVFSKVAIVLIILQLIGLFFCAKANASDLEAEEQRLQAEAEAELDAILNGDTTPNHHKKTPVERRWVCHSELTGIEITIIKSKKYVSDKSIWGTGYALVLVKNGPQYGLDYIKDEVFGHIEGLTYRFDFGKNGEGFNYSIVIEGNRAYYYDFSHGNTSAKASAVYTCK